MKHSTNLIVIVSTLLTFGAIFSQQATANEASQLQYEMVVVGNLANKSSVPTPRGWKGHNQMTAQQAQAYSNRGAMRIMSGDATGAEEDFQVAIKHNANLHAPARNLARVQLESTGPIVAKLSH